MLHVRLKSARKAKGLSQMEVAEALTVAQSFVSKLESGDKLPSVTMLRKLASLYGVSETYLVGNQALEVRVDGESPASLIQADPDAPPGLRELAADSALTATLDITNDEWRSLRSIELASTVSKAGYVQLLTTIRGISRT